LESARGLRINAGIARRICPAALSNLAFRLSESPSFSKTLRPDMLGEIGGKVVIPCDALGVPQPNITWFRNAVEINPKTEKR